MPTSFHELINTKIAELGLNPAQLRDRLERQGASVHPNTVYQWTHGIAVPTRHRLAALLDALHITEQEERAAACMLAALGERDDRSNAPAVVEPS